MPSPSSPIREKECATDLGNLTESLSVADYFETFSVTVLEIDLHLEGFTVTVTLQDPALNPRSLTPETLQTFACLAETFIDTFDPEGTLIPANLAIDFVAIDFELVTFGAPADLLVVPREIHEVLLPALSDIRIRRLPKESFWTVDELTPNPSHSFDHR